MAKADDNRYRVELFREYAKGDPETRAEIKADLAHQRRLDVVFVVFEGLTVGFGALLALLTLGLAAYMVGTGHPVPAAYTSIGDVSAVAAYLVRRSYFLSAAESKAQDPGKDQKALPKRNEQQELTPSEGGGD